MSGPPLLKIDHLSCVFRTPTREIRAVNSVSLEIAEGSFTAIVGASGSGKTTLLSVMGLIEQPTEGLLEMAGRDLTTLSSREASQLRRRSIRTIPQTLHLIERRTALENVRIGDLYVRDQASGSLERATEVLTDVGLAERIHQPVNRLSGGERQRVAIARALTVRPRLLLCDEPTANLDGESKDVVMGLLQQARDYGATGLLHVEVTGRV